MRTRMVKLTVNAKTYLRYKRLQNNKKFIKLALKPSGCAGFEYDWSYMDEMPAGSSLVQGLIAMDSKTQEALKGSTIDYVSELFGSSLKITNPNVQDACGCGVSFTI